MPERTRVLVMGSTGFIGRNIVERLAGAGLEVYPVVRRGSLEKKRGVYTRFLETGAVPIVVDRVSVDRVSGVLREYRIDVVINSIGVLRGSPRELYEAHVGVTRDLLYSLSETRPLPLYIHISSIAASDLRGPRPLREEDRHCGHIDRVSTLYERTKCLSEILVRRFSEKTGLYYVILRPSVVIGRYNTHPEWVSLYILSRRGVLLDTDLRLSITDVRDLVDMVQVFIRDREDLYRDYYHVVSPREVSLREISLAMARALGVRPLVRVRGLEVLRPLVERIPVDPIMGGLARHLFSRGLVVSSEKLVSRTGHVFRDPIETVLDYTMWLSRQTLSSTRQNTLYRQSWRGPL